MPALVSSPCRHSNTSRISRETAAKEILGVSKTEALIRSILGPARRDIRPLVYAVECTLELLVDQGVVMDEILVTKDVYIDVARRLGKSICAVTRGVQRLSRDCWNAMVSRDLVMAYVGAPLSEVHGPAELLFYLAFYLHWDAPFYSVTQPRPNQPLSLYPRTGKLRRKE